MTRNYYCLKLVGKDGRWKFYTGLKSRPIIKFNKDKVHFFYESEMSDFLLKYFVEVLNYRSAKWVKVKFIEEVEEQIIKQI